MYIKYFDIYSQRMGMDIEILSNGARLYSLEGQKHMPSVFIAAGQHGDERAGSIALLELMRNEQIPTLGSIRICPIVSPEAWDLNVREEYGVDLNRTWSPEKANNTILSLMMSIESNPPSVFIDHHESGTNGVSDVLPRNGTKYELRYSGSELNRNTVTSDGRLVNFLKISKHHPDSSIQFARSVGAKKAVCVETNVFLDLVDRVDFHKQIITHAFSI